VICFNDTKFEQEAREAFGAKFLHLSGWKAEHAPALIMIFQACKVISDFLLKDNENVIVLHCENEFGEGRVATIITSFMMYCGFADTAQNALAYYVAKKYQNEAQPFQHISLIRYMTYMERTLNSNY
jgi:protein-tyrosine phosphatase